MVYQSVSIYLSRHLHSAQVNLNHPIWAASYTAIVFSGLSIDWFVEFFFFFLSCLVVEDVWWILTRRKTLCSAGGGTRGHSSGVRPGEASTRQGVLPPPPGPGLHRVLCVEDISRPHIARILKLREIVWSECICVYSPLMCVFCHLQHFFFFLTKHEIKVLTRAWSFCLFCHACVVCVDLGRTVL